MRLGLGLTNVRQVAAPGWAVLQGQQPTIAMDFANNRYFGAKLADITTTRSVGGTATDSSGASVPFSADQVRRVDLGIYFDTTDTMIIGGALATVLQRSTGTLVAEFNPVTGAANTALIGGISSVQLVSRSGSAAGAGSFNGAQNLSVGTNSPGNGKSFDSNVLAASLAYDGTGRSITLGGGAVGSDANGLGNRSTVFIGRHSGGSATSGYLRSLFWFPTRLADATAQALAFYGPTWRRFAGWGDSTMAGSGASVAAARWNEQLSAGYSPAAFLNNQGQGGDTSSQVLTRFLADVAPTADRDMINLFWCGHNTPSATQTVSDLRAMVALLTGERRYLVLQPIQNTDNAVGSASYNEVIATRAAILAAFPANRVVDVPAALAAANPTDPNVANGYTPSTLLFDTIHLNDSGQDVVTTAARAALNTLGW